MTTYRRRARICCTPCSGGVGGGAVPSLSTPATHIVTEAAVRPIEITRTRYVTFWHHDTTRLHNFEYYACDHHAHRASVAGFQVLPLDVWFAMLDLSFRVRDITAEKAAETAAAAETVAALREHGAALFGTSRPTTISGRFFSSGPNLQNIPRRR